MMTAVLAIWAACVLFAFWLSSRWRRERDLPKLVPLSRESVRPPPQGVSERAGERCVLCNGRLPFQLTTRAEVIARIEHRIGVDSAAVAQLLASPPSDAWVRLFRP